MERTCLLALKNRNGILINVKFFKGVKSNFVPSGQELEEDEVELGRIADDRDEVKSAKVTRMD